MKIFLNHPRNGSRAAFTMIEIALCLAIIGFALVAIIGVLPTGLNVQRDNREETIINQDATVLMGAIRNGAQGYHELTNYIIGITNYWTVYKVTATETNVVTQNFDGYTFSGSDVRSVTIPPLVSPLYGLTNGESIIGLLSTPKYIPLPPVPGEERFRSNYVVAYFRAISGSAADKAPQANDTVLEGAFRYRLIVENIPYVPVSPVSTNSALYATNSPEWKASVQQIKTLHTLMTNSHDLRLTFRWPVLPNFSVGNGRLTFRAFTGGWLKPTNDFYSTSQPLYFFQPSVYVP